MIDDNVFVPVTTHIATVSRMLTDSSNIREIGTAACEQALVIASGVAAGVVLGLGSDEREIIAVAQGPTTSLLDTVLLEVGSACIDYNAVVVVDDTADPPARWSHVGAAASGHGIAGLRAYPVRHGPVAVGALVVGTPAPWSARADDRSAVPRDPMALQVLADLVGGAVRLSADDAAGSSWADTIRGRATETAQFEQAVGVIAERHALAIPAATEVLYGLTRRTRLPVSVIAERILSGVTLDALVEGILDR